MDLELFLSLMFLEITSSYQKLKINTICVRDSRSLPFCKKVALKNFIHSLEKTCLLKRAVPAQPAA